MPDLHEEHPIQAQARAFLLSLGGLLNLDFLLEVACGPNASPGARPTLLDLRSALALPEAPSPGMALFKGDSYEHGAFTVVRNGLHRWRVWVRQQHGFGDWKEHGLHGDVLILGHRDGQAWISADASEALGTLQATLMAKDLRLRGGIWR